MKVAGAVEYFREHMVGDYLTEDGRVEMTWHGAAAARFGLAGPCHSQHFESLCAATRPGTGEKLLPREKEGRRVCYFAQISAPKDVSIAHLVGGDDRIAGWWREAVEETLREIEAVTATRVRVGGADDDRTTGEMIAAVVTHDTNRALDPQLHTHVCIMNLTFDKVEGRWKSVQPFAFYQHQAFFREVCYNKLASRLIAGGYDIEQVRGIGFDLKGFPPALRNRFSKRRRQILREAASTGATSQDELQAITARTRSAKTRATAPELRAGWVAEAGPEADAIRQVIAAARSRTVERTTVPPLEALASAEAHVFERRSVIEERVLLREGLVAARGAVELNELRDALGARIASGALVRDDANIASRESLQAESEFTTWAESHREDSAPLGIAGTTTGLAKDQADAVTELLRSRSRVTIFQGDAGTGKTTSLRAVVAGIEKAGGSVFALAPTASAVDVLRSELTPHAETVQQLLANPVLQAKIRGLVLVVDEAGLVSVRQMRDLCHLSAANNHRLLLVGDTKQHSSVEAGDALRCLQQFARVPVARLTQIRRQSNSAYRAAVAQLARGDALGAINRFAKLGTVHETNDPRQMFLRAAADYVQTVRAGKSCLVISPVWAEIHTFTKDVRQRLKAYGALSRDERVLRTLVSLNWTREEMRRLENYQPGDVLTFHRAAAGFAKGEELTVVRREQWRLVVQTQGAQECHFDPRRTGGFDVALPVSLPVSVGDRLMIRDNLKSAGLRNGDIVEVAAMSADGAIGLKDGRTIPAPFRRFAHGYATTSHAAQGRTVQRGILLMGDEGIAAGNLKQAYVSNSRFQDSQAIYTTDLKAAREAMQHPGDRMLASELLPPASPSRFRRSLLSRLYRAGRVRARVSEAVK